MQSFTHLLQSGAVAAPSSTASLASATVTTRETVLIAHCRERGGASNWLLHRQIFGLGFGFAVNLKLRISVSQGLAFCFSCGIRNFECAWWDRVNWASGTSGVTGALVMQRLLLVSQRRMQVETKTSRLCVVCRSSSGSKKGAGEGEYDRRAELEVSPPQDVVLKAISEVSKSEGRVGRTTNMVIGGTVKKDSDSEWNAIDQKVNVYPMVRDFTAIGTGGDEFVQAMVQAVESITETRTSKVTKKLSSQGKYVSVKIVGITVTSSEQVRAVYDAMRKDVRMKYFL